MSVNEQLDQSTGEFSREPSFVKIYTENLWLIKGITGREYQVFMLLAGRMDDKNCVSIGPREKAVFLTAQGMNEQVFKNTISSMLKKRLIKRIRRGFFVVNPRLAAKSEYGKSSRIEF